MLHAGYSAQEKSVQLRVIPQSSDVMATINDVTTLNHDLQRFGHFRFHKPDEEGSPCFKKRLP